MPTLDLISSKTLKGATFSFRGVVQEVEHRWAGKVTA